MPLVGQKCGPHGLRSWRIVKAADPKSLYSIIALLEFDAMEQFAAAAAAEGATAFGDYPEFQQSAAPKRSAG